MSYMSDNSSHHQEGALLWQQSSEGKSGALAAMLNLAAKVWRQDLGTT